MFYFTSWHILEQIALVTQMNFGAIINFCPNCHISISYITQQNINNLIYHSIIYHCSKIQWIVMIWIVKKILILLITNKWKNKNNLLFHINSPRYQIGQLTIQCNGIKNIQRYKNPVFNLKKRKNSKLKMTQFIYLINIEHMTRK